MRVEESGGSEGYTTLMSDPMKPRASRTPYPTCVDLLHDPTSQGTAFTEEKELTVSGRLFPPRFSRTNNSAKIIENFNWSRRYRKYLTDPSRTGTSISSIA